MEEENKDMMIYYMKISKKIHKLFFSIAHQEHIYPEHPHMIYLLRNNSGITQKDLADKNCTKPASVTGMLQKLESSGYIKRIPDKMDKRVMHVYLTQKGADFAKKCDIYMERFSEQIFGNFTVREKEQYYNIMGKIYNNIGKYDIND